jgi:Immunoglobulin I-set domain
MRNETALFLALLVCLTVSCGHSDLPSSSVVSVTVAPSTVTVQVGQTVEFRGTATGFTQPTIDWWEQDQHDAAVNGYGEEDCDDVTDASSDPTSTCPFGYLTGSAMTDASTGTATYHAPTTPGTYHVTFRAFQVSMTQVGDTLEKRATATISVAQ